MFCYSHIYSSYGPIIKYVSSVCNLTLHSTFRSLNLYREEQLDFVLTNFHEIVVLGSNLLESLNLPTLQSDSVQNDQW